MSAPLSALDHLEMSYSQNKIILTFSWLEEFVLSMDLSEILVYLFSLNYKTLGLS